MKAWVTVILTVDVDDSHAAWTEHTLNNLLGGVDEVTEITVDWDTVEEADDDEEED